MAMLENPFEGSTMNLVKKLFNSFVAFVTILSSVGTGVLALPSAASAASIMSGDLIKASTPAVYYYGSDGKRYVFPNEKTYFTWYANFSSVKTITDAELAAIMIGGNVTYKPGVKMVKITTDPKVYAVGANGSLRWVASEAVAIGLYGANWNKMIDDVPDAFFVNYTVGAAINAVADFTPATVTANAGSINADKNLGTGTGGSVATGSIAASLASDTPAGTTLPKNANSVMLAKFNLMAGSNDAVVTGMKVRRQGSGVTTDFSNVYLYDANGTRLTTGRTINSLTHMAEFNGLNVKVAAGQTVTLAVWGDLSNPGTAGGQHAFELSDASAVVLSGAGTVSGVFPVRGNTFSVGTASVGRLDVQKGTTPTNPNVGSKEVEISNFKLVANTNDIELRRLTLIQAGTITNTDLTNLKLFQSGKQVAAAAALVGDKIVLNFDPVYVIPNGTTRVFSLKGDVAGRSSRTIKTYVEYTTDVYAVDKIYNAGAQVDITTNGTFDGTGTDYVEVTTQGGQLTVTFNGPTTANVAKGTQDVALFKFSLTSQENQLEIRNVDFKIQGVGAADLVKGSASTEYFRDIKIKNADTGETWMGPTSMPSALAASSTDTGVMTLSDSRTLEPGKTYNFVITSDLANSEDETNEFFSTGSHQYRVVMGDGSSNLFGSSDVRVVSTGEYLATSKIVPNSSITGNPMTVKGATLSVSLAGSPSSGTVVKKQTNVPSLGLVFTAGGQSDITVTTLTLTGSATTTVGTGGSYSAALLDDVVNSCALFDTDTNLQVGDAKSPDATAGTMAISNMNLKVLKGTSKTLQVRCTLDSVVTDTTNGDKFAIGIAAATDITANDEQSNTLGSTDVTVGTTLVNNAGTASASFSVTQTVKDSGTLTIATDNLRQSTILVAGGDVWHNMGQFRATAQNEDITIDMVAVTSTGDASYFTEVAIAQNGAVKGSSILPSGVYQTKNIDLSGNPITVPKNGSATFQVWGKLSTIVASSSVNGATTGVARTGGQIALGLASDLQSGEWSASYDEMYNVRTTGIASGQRVYAASAGTNSMGTAGNTFVVRKTKPTITRQSLSSSTLTAGTTDLYKFNVSADAAGSIGVKKFTFSLTTATTTASSLSLSNFRLRRGSSDIGLSDVTITDGLGNDLEAGTWINDATNNATPRVVITLTGEDTISGSGNTYTLYATVGGTVLSGDSVTVSLTRTADTTLGVTGWLTGTNATSSAVWGPHINTDTAIAQDVDSTSTFIWSDLSEVPHYTNTSGASRSRDWTNDYLVEDLTQTQVLSR